MIKSNKKTIYEALGRNPVHPFPARMAPGIALDFVSASKKSIRVLDPMMGSGTVIALARSKGHHAIGIDIDPLSVLISKAWTTAIDQSMARKRAHEVLVRAREEFATLALSDAYPFNADYETRKFVRYWFDHCARRQLATLATAIHRTRDKSIRDVLWCAFSRLIITKQAGASLAMDLAHSRPHKSFASAPIKPFNKFLTSVETVLANCVDSRTRPRGPVPSIRLGDARCLRLSNSSVDLVLTSPPYLNAIDYMRCSKFSLVWMGYGVLELQNLRSRSVGTEIGQRPEAIGGEIRRIISDLNLRPRLSDRDERVLARYIGDMRSAMLEVSRVLSPGGIAVYVVGENMIKGTYIRNSKILLALAQTVGLKLSKQSTRRLPANRRYLPPPLRGKVSQSLNSRIRREIVLTFAKPTRSRKQ